MADISRALIKLLNVLPQAVAALPEVAELVQEVQQVFTEDQGELQATLLNVRTENRAGFAELDKKLSDENG